MKRYKNLAGGSGVVAYDIGEDRITVRFSKGEPYTYSYETLGRENVEHMKRLAIAGRGLSTYISRFGKDKYVKSP